MWKKGQHEELLSQGDSHFLSWAANYGMFPYKEWADNFLLVGRLKRDMWKSVGVRPFLWAPEVELRMPWGCSAFCRYCPGAKQVSRNTIPPSINTYDSLQAAIPHLKIPETVLFCAEWGDCCLHPDIIKMVNVQVETKWLVTRYCIMTNLSSLENIELALPYARSILPHFTMSRPEHAREIMGYKSEAMFKKIYDNIKRLCKLNAKNPTTEIHIVFVVDQSSIPYISEHYSLFKDMEGLRECLYKSAYGLEKILPNNPDAIRQKKLVEEMGGGVEYGFTF